MIKSFADAETEKVFTAPARNSANGTITYNAPSLEHGVTFENVCLTFEQGRIVKATGTPQDKLTAHLDTDEGARYLGEFALGVNPFITSPLRDILYDEEIAGSQRWCARMDCLYWWSWKGCGLEGLI